MSSPPSLPALRDAVAARYDLFLRQLERLVNIDCGSYTRDGVNAVAEFCAGELRALGADVVRIPHRPSSGQAAFGDLVIARLDGRGPRLLLAAHMDTVFDPGTAADRPFRVEGSRAHGPGVADMKAGLLAGLHAIRALHQLGVRPRLTFVCNPDEEIGSPFSSPVIAGLAAEHDAGLVLECARANGDLVSARKGTAEGRVTLRGRAAHAGIEPEKGRSAILAAAHAAIALDALNGRWPTVTLNVGTLRGGTRANVVPEVAEIEIDLRAASRDELDAAWAAADEVVGAPAVAGVVGSLERAAFHPPMERSPAGERLVELAQRLANGLGFTVRDASTGGAGDANTIAAAGLPTLDGLGPIGGDDHSSDEWVDLDSIVPRTALLAAIVATAREAL